MDGREEEGTGLGRNLGESRGASPTAGRFQMRPDPPRAPPRLEAASPPLASGRGDCFRQRSREKPRRVTSEWAGEGPALIPREPSWLPATPGAGGARRGEPEHVEGTRVAALAGSPGPATLQPPPPRCTAWPGVLRPRLHEPIEAH